MSTKDQQIQNSCQPNPHMFVQITNTIKGNFNLNKTYRLKTKFYLDIMANN